jgi:hypothetical protein
MNLNKTLGLLVCALLTLSIAACQSATPSPLPDATVEARPTSAAYPASSSQANPTAGSYPASASNGNTAMTAPYPSSTENMIPTSAAYPAPQNGETVSWDNAQQLIIQGIVTKIVQTQSLDVTLTLNSGITVKTTAPAADAAQKAITTCGDPCKNLTVTNQ